MYRPSESSHYPPPFGPPPPHGTTFRPQGPCCGHLPPGPFGLFSASAPNSHFLPSGHFISPHCSNFSIDHSTVITLGGNQQITTPAEPPPLPVLQWNPSSVEHHPSDNSDQAGEEFLRCIAANKPLPDYLKGNMAYNLADAIKSSNALKAAIRSDPESQKHVTRSKSRSWSRSRGKSRAKSHAKSKSRGRSRGRDKSCSCGKSHARGKSRAHSRSQSQSRSKNKSHAQSKSGIRRSKSRSRSSEKSRVKDKRRMRSPSCSSIVSSNNLEGLKLVMNSKELEDRLAMLKDAIITIQASDRNKKVESVPDKYRHRQLHSQEGLTSFENDSMLLPHDRVGSDFSWLQVQSQEDSTVQKASDLEDEESFLYGSEDTGGKQDNKSCTALSQVSQIGEFQDMSALYSQQHHQYKSISSSFGDVLNLKQPLQMTSSSLVSANLDSNECEKLKNIVNYLGTTNISDIMMKMQWWMEEKQQSSALPGSDPTAANLAMPAMSNPNVQQALESLQSLIKAAKEKLTKSDGSSTNQTSDKHKADDNEERKREKQARISKIESLMKELEGLLKQDGLDFLRPVIGFYCQKCEEFIGDFNCTEKHAAVH